MTDKWFIIGISGATCGGKTTLANKLRAVLPNSQAVSQDNYFLPVDDERHVWIPELNHINFDVLTSLDMNKMYDDVNEIISDSACPVNVAAEQSELFRSNSNSLTDLEAHVTRKLKEMHMNILIVEGFCIFYHKPIKSLCNLKYFITLEKDECYKRRILRLYEPPDCPGYFEHCVWPEYVRQLDDIKNSVENVHFLSEYTEDPVKVILQDLKQIFDSMSN